MSKEKWGFMNDNHNYKADCQRLERMLDKKNENNREYAISLSFWEEMMRCSEDDKYKPQFCNID